MGNGREDKKVCRLFLIWKMKKSSILVKYIRNIFLTMKTKSSLSTSVFIFSTFSQIKKKNFMYFGHKHVETEPSYSLELATFLKYHRYHMPLKCEVKNK